MEVRAGQMYERMHKDKRLRSTLPPFIFRHLRYLETDSRTGLIDKSNFPSWFITWAMRSLSTKERTSVVLQLEPHNA